MPAIPQLLPHASTSTSPIVSSPSVSDCDYMSYPKPEPHIKLSWILDAQKLGDSICGYFKPQG